MKGDDPFYLYPLEGEYLKYFVGREKEIDYVMKITTLYNGMVIPVLGGIGSGKTSFLNAVRQIYIQRTRSTSSVAYVKASDVLRWYGLDKNAELLLIDDVGDLNDSDVEKFYKKIYDLAHKHMVNIVFADKVERGRSSQKLRDWVATGRKLWMDWPLDILVENMKKRFEAGGLREIFTEDALRIIAIRTGSNIREFLKYAREAYLEYGEQGQITKEMVTNVIMQIDSEEISRMNEVARAIIKVLRDKVQQGYGGGINAKMLKMYVDEVLQRTISTTTFYETLRYLAEDRYIVSRRRGKETIYSSIYDEMGVDMAGITTGETEYRDMEME